MGPGHTKPHAKQKNCPKTRPKGPAAGHFTVKTKRAATLADAAALFNPWDSRGTIYCVPHKNTGRGDLQAVAAACLASIWQSSIKSKIKIPRDHKKLDFLRFMS
jgi:hypothetical protein